MVLLNIKIIFLFYSFLYDKNLLYIYKKYIYIVNIFEKIYIFCIIYNDIIFKYIILRLFILDIYVIFYNKRFEIKIFNKKKKLNFHLYKQ